MGELICIGVVTPQHPAVQHIPALSAMRDDYLPGFLRALAGLLRGGGWWWLRIATMAVITPIPGESSTLSSAN